MKRKSISPVVESFSDSELQAETKRVKTNDYAKFSLEKSKDGFEEQLHKISLNKRHVNTSVDRFLDSLMKQERNRNTEKKHQQADPSRSPICKDLSSTYRVMDDITNMSPRFHDPNTRSFSELKEVRKLAKLNKIDESGSEQGKDFVEKISRQLEIVTNTITKEAEYLKRSETKRSESLKKHLESVKISSKKEPYQITMEEEGGSLTVPPITKEFVEITPTKEGQCPGPDFYKVLTADQTPNSKEEDRQDSKEAIEIENGGLLPGIKINELQVPVDTGLLRGRKPSTSPDLRGLIPPRSTSGREKNKRRESFSINDPNSKSKAFHTFSSSLKENHKDKESKDRLTSRRSSTCPKPVTNVAKRKSMIDDESSKGSATKVRTGNVRKSLIPEKTSTFEEMTNENRMLKKDLERKNKEIENLRREKQALIKKFKNLGTEMAEEDKNQIEGKTKIFCRVKPSEQGDVSQMLEYPERVGQGSHGFPIRCITMNNLSKKLPYYFDRVFSQVDTQSELFKEIQPSIERVLEGNHLCIVAFGQPNTGKTYTIEGENLWQHSMLSEGSGIIPRAAEILLAKSQYEMGNDGRRLQLYFGSILLKEGQAADLLETTASEIDEEKEVQWFTISPEDIGLLRTISWDSVADLKELVSSMNKVARFNKVKDTGVLELKLDILKIESGTRDFFIYFLKVPHGIAQTKSPGKTAGSRVLMNSINQVQSLFENIKETQIFFTLSSDEKDESEIKETLEVSHQFSTKA